MIATLQDVLLVGLGAFLALAVTFAGAAWLLRDTLIPDRREDRPGG